MLYDQKAGYQTQLKNAAQQYEQKIAVLEKSIQLVTQYENCTCRFRAPPSWLQAKPPESCNSIKKKWG